MNSTTQFAGLDVHEKITVNTKELQAVLGCGRSSAVRIGETAEARVQIGKRVLWNLPKVTEYINSIST